MSGPQRLIQSAALCMLAALVGTSAASAASKEIITLQREMSMLLVEVRQLKSQYGERMAVLEELTKQNLEVANRMNQAMAVLERQLAKQSESLERPVSSMSTRVENVSNDFRNLRAAVEAINTRLSRVQQDVEDIKSHLTTLPPPSFEGDETASAVDPSSASTLFDAALGDFHRGNYELSKVQFNDYLRDYGRSLRAVEAQYYLGAIAYSEQDYLEATRNFDLVLERYQVASITPDAQYKKAMSLMKLNRLDEAGAELQSLVERFPNSSVTPNAEAQLEELRSFDQKPSPTRRSSLTN
ncbi:MAG: outer membrane protein assembly factor BamD [Bryobacterales bacterium]|nr:outer membrane protein assembly factor BamD [Bryobacterales bacterium]